MKNWAEGIFRYIFYMTQSLIDIPFKVINYVIKNGIDIPYNHEIMLVIYVLAVNITFIFTINRIMWMLLEQEKIDYKNIVIRFGLTIGGIFGLQYILHFLNWIKDIMILGFYKEVNLDKFIDVEPLLQWIINYETHASVKAFFLTFLICFSLIICSVLIYFIGNMFLTILKIYILTVFMPLYISCIANEDYEKEGIEALKKYFGYLYKLAVFYLNIYFISYIFSNDIIKRIIETSFPNFSEVKVQNLTYLIEASLGTVLLIMTGSFLVLIYKNNKRKKILKQKLKEDKKLLKLKENKQLKKYWKNKRKNRK